MSDLRQLAILRLRQSGLPEFVGASVSEKLATGRAAARNSLIKYVPELTLDVAAARDVMSEVNAWVDRNQNELSSAMESTETKLPRWLFLNMGNSERVQQWVIANYTVAVSGMGPWQSGKIDQLVADPASDVSEEWAATDARSRLDAFAMIVKMDNDGDLEYIFRGSSATGAFGVAPVVVWAVVVAVVAFAAVVVSYYYLSRRLELNNALMADICRKAQQEGDKATIAKCIEATKEIQIDTPLSGLTSEIGRVALVLGVSYLAFRYGLPVLLDYGAKALSRGGPKSVRA